MRPEYKYIKKTNKPKIFKKWNKMLNNSKTQFPKLSFPIIKNTYSNKTKIKSKLKITQTIMKL